MMEVGDVHGRIRASCTRRNIVDDFVVLLVVAPLADSAGHVHDYTVNWPLDNTSTVTQRNYVNPTGTIHICGEKWNPPIQC